MTKFATLSFKDKFYQTVTNWQIGRLIVYKYECEFRKKSENETKPFFTPKNRPFIEKIWQV